MLIKQTLQYLPAQVLAPAVQFISIIVWAWILSAEQLGMVTLLIAAQEICYAAFFGWLAYYTLRFLPSFSAGEERHAFLQSEAAIICIAGVLQSLVAVPVMAAVFGHWPSWEVSGLIVAFMLTRSINTYNGHRARSETQIGLYTLVQVVGPVAGFLAGLAIMWQFGPSFEAVVIGFILAQVIGIILAVWMGDFLSAAPHLKREILLKAYRFGGTQAVSGLLTIVALNAPRFIVSRTLGLGAAGIFSIGYSLGLRAASFAVTLVTAGAYPLVVRKMHEEGRDAAFAQLRQNMVLVAITVVPVAMGLLAVNTSLTHLIVAEDYREVTAWVLPLAAIGGLFRNLRAHTLDQVFLLNLRPGFGTMVAACDFVLGVAAAFAGAAWLGITGAALGPMVAGIFSFALAFVLSHRKFGFNLPMGQMVRVFIAGGLMAAGVGFMPSGTTIAWLAVLVATGACIYALALAILMRKDLLPIIARLRTRKAA